MGLSTFMQAPPNVVFFRHAPLWMAKRYLHLIGSLYYIANRRERSLIERNIRSVFRNGEDTGTIIRKTFEGIYNHYSEKLLMAYRDFDRLKEEIGGSISYVGLDTLDRALETGGVLMVTGHFGAVEFMPLAFHLAGYPVSMVVAFKTERLKESLTARAREKDVELIDGHGKNVVTEVIDALHRGRIVVTECDEVDAWRTKQSRTIEAFGGSIRLDRTMDVLCRRCGTPVLFGMLIRNDRGYCLRVEPLAERAVSEAGNSISVTIMKTFERFVMAFPDQWYQWKKLHKMRPEFA